MDEGLRANTILVGDLVRFKNGMSLLVVLATNGDTASCVLLPRGEGEPVITVPLERLEHALRAANDAP